MDVVEPAMGTSLSKVSPLSVTENSENPKTFQRLIECGSVASFFVASPTVLIIDCMMLVTV